MHGVCDVHVSAWCMCVCLWCGMCVHGVWCVFVVCVCGVCLWCVFVVCVCGVCGVCDVCGVCVWSVCKATLARSRVIGCAFKVVPQYLSEKSESHLFMWRLRVDGAWFPSQHIQLTAPVVESPRLLILYLWYSTPPLIRC